MTDTRELARRYRGIYDDGQVGTHWATCDEAHPVCALLRLCDAVLADDHDTIVTSPSVLNEEEGKRFLAALNEAGPQLVEQPIPIADEGVSDD